MAFLDRLAILVSLDSRGAAREIQAIGSAADRDLGRAQMGADRLGSTFLKTGAVMVGVAGVVGVGLFKMAQAFEEAQRSELLLDNTLANMPALAGENRESFIGLADAIQDKTAADGDQIVSAQALLGTFPATGAEIRKITPLVVDYARKFGIDLPSAAIQVGKALQGQIGALQRNGVSIDENVFATDRFAAVQQALRDQVGGFAEQEGKTMSGRLQRLKNEFGDVAEGIGSGVVGAFETLFDVADPVLDVLSGIDDATGGAIGKFATFATVGVGAAGVLTMLAGAGMKAKTNWGKFADDMPRMATGVRGVATAGVALGVAFGIATGVVELFGKTTQDRIDELNREGKRGIEELARNFARLKEDGTPEQFNIQMQGMRETLKEIAQESPEMGRQLAAALEAEGVSAGFLRREVEASTEAKRRANEVAQREVDLTRTKVELKEEEAQAHRDATSAQIAEFSSQVAFEQSRARAQEALARYNFLLAAGVGLTTEGVQANQEARTAILERATAAAKLAEDDAKAAGKADAAAIGQAAFRQELQKISGELAPGSALKSSVKGWIDDLGKIDKKHNAKVDVDFAKGAENRLLRIEQRMANLKKGVDVEVRYRETGDVPARGGP